MREYKVNGEYHRIGGPAVLWPDGTKMWYINGFYYTKEEYDEKMQEIVENAKKSAEKG